MKNIKITEDEEKWIKSFKRLAKKCPKSLWLYSASGSLNVMKYKKDAYGNFKIAFEEEDGMGGIDQGYSLDIIDIPNDGGDW